MSNRLTITLLALLITLLLLSSLCITTIDARDSKRSNKKDTTTRKPNKNQPPPKARSTHYDLPLTNPNDVDSSKNNKNVKKDQDNEKMSLETVLLFSRHGNRAADPIVEALCPKRSALTELYHHQQASYGALTFNGIRGMWDLGSFTHYNYMQNNNQFLSPTYTRLSSQIHAASSDRTLISASAFGQTAFNQQYAESTLPIPVAVVTRPAEEDNMLEVRKARCTERLETDLHYFDQNLAQELIDSHSELINMISNACGFDILHGPELTNGEFSVMQLVKDLSDALTGDLLEDFPLMDGVTVESRQKFLQFAEDIFKQRHYRTNEMDAYLSGNVPNRMIKLFDRRVSFNTNTTTLDQQPLNTVDERTYRDVIVEDAKRLPIIRPRPPRRLFAFHAHREVLYGLKNFLQLDLGVERPGLPTGLLHPSTGIFFELWKDNKQVEDLINEAADEAILPALNPDRKNSQRYLTNIVDDGYYVRIVLWVPCFEGMEAVSGLDGKPIEFKHVDADGMEICLARVRTLDQCDKKEFCPLSRVKEIIATNYNAANGDFRQHCPVHRDLDSGFAEAAGFFVGTKGSNKRSKQFKSATVRTAIGGFFGDEKVTIVTETTPEVKGTEPLAATTTMTTQNSQNVQNAQNVQAVPVTPSTNPHHNHMVEEFREEVDNALEHDSDSFDDFDRPIVKKRNKKVHPVTNAAGFLHVRDSKEDIYNNQYQSPWVRNLANVKPQPQKP